ncbi:hypothetical protein H696_01371 [Fonticula alba]|uniref:Nucleolar GTP-binding protein 1 n=1 Tax=Fonticula alba TaxID=691883 RepID=A0A058ZET8_FONAL|nr:hypothetical protein H696_01371 [Fonticula alba]KCV71962.1 hypothetical protein H696_01371 [Fonticula alba]|eukprot:XP_009493540.1 hypothetical protein H696_01371 [Fonticula alba]
MSYNFKKIQVVPSSTDFVDIVLSKTQRKTPTVIHKGYAISRIRNFYIRKCKFSQQTFHDKLSQILADFPQLDDVHPFYGDLMNVLYDRDHYKLALGQINAARQQVDNIAKDYLRLLKYGDSLYRCKQLKRACLGRMCTLMARLKDTLAYLEQVRQHLARLPSIDPNTRTLLITGYPNVGKSSFMNKVTRADVEVQPYAFTTKSLFVGHMDYRYLRWQVIDSPGILDHPLEDRNTIEMQSITALAHLRCCVLFFIDVSEDCGYTLAQQVALFHSIRPLFTNKPVVLVLSKLDLMRYEQLSDEGKAQIQTCLDTGATMVEASTLTEEGVMDVKQTACDKLLAMRVENKLRNKKAEDITSRLHLAMPTKRDDVIRMPIRPEGEIVPYDPKDPNRVLLAKDYERMGGGAGVYNVDLRADYLLKNPEWKYDAIPEIWDGKNIIDFVDPDIEEKLLALEREEEALEAAGFYDEDEEIEDEELTAKRELAAQIRAKKDVLKQRNHIKAMSRRNKAPMPRTKTAVSATEFISTMRELGLDITDVNGGERTSRRERSKRMRDGEEGGSDAEMAVDTDGPAGGPAKRSRSMVRSESRARSLSMPREPSAMGLRDSRQVLLAANQISQSQRRLKTDGRRGEADRHIPTNMPRHMFSGKRKQGTNDRR